MTKMYPLILLGAISLLVFSQCSLLPCGGSKEGLIRKIQALSEKAGQQDWPASDQRWKAYDEQLEKLLDDCLPKYEEEMTFGEQKDVLVASSKYYYRRFGKGLMRNLLEEKKGLFGDVRKLTEEDLEDLADEIESDVQDWARKIEEIFK